MHLMSIETKHLHLPSLVKRHNSSRVSVEEILADFKSLEDLGHSNTSSTTEDYETPVRENYKKYLQLRDFRRFRSYECQDMGSKFRKLNRSYSLQEIKEAGLELKSERKGPQQKYQDQSLILSEFIL